jgi:hypothetical protein
LTHSTQLKLLALTLEAQKMQKKPINSDEGNVKKPINPED